MYIRLTPGPLIHGTDPGGRSFTSDPVVGPTDPGLSERVSPSETERPWEDCRLGLLEMRSTDRGVPPPGPRGLQFLDHPPTL